MKRIATTKGDEGYYSMYTPLSELVEAFTKLKIQEGYSQQEAESTANTVF